MCSISSISSNSIGNSTRSRVFFERFLDDDDFTLLGNNYWLRERIYDRELAPYEMILSHVDGRPLADSMNVLSCRQWKSEPGIDLELQKLGKSSSFRTVIAAYNVFRYPFGETCTFDQAVFDTSDLSCRHETLSLRFPDPAALIHFHENNESQTEPNLSKVVACFKQENEGAMKVLQKLGKETDLPLYKPSWDPPDLSRLNLYEEED